MHEDRSVLSRSVAPPDAVVRYGELAEHLADVRFGAITTAAASRPLILLIHGGFWRPEYDRTHTGPMCNAIAKAGWTIAAIEYRRIPGKPDATLSDIQLALSSLPALTQHHNGNVIVIGHSAGGQLALWVAAITTSRSIIKAIALAPIADLQYAYDHQLDQDAVVAFLGEPPNRRIDVDPFTMPTPTVATTLVHGVDDAIAPIAMSERYIAKHPQARLTRIDHCGHFALIDPLSTAWSHVVGVLES